MATPVLAKLLAQPRLREVVLQLVAALDVPVTVLDAGGGVVLGAASPVAGHPVTSGAETIGWVAAPRGAEAVARLLGALASAENDKRELAREGVQKYKELALLYDVSEKIGACLRVEDTARLVLEEVRRIIRRGSPCLVLLDPDTGGIAQGPDSDLPAAPQELRPFLAGLAHQGAAEIVNRIAEDPRLAGSGTRAASLMTAPLKTRGSTLGALVVLCDEAVDFRSEELRLLCGLATLCAASMEKARLYLKVESETRLRSHFQRYLSPSVVEDIIAHRAEVGLGGKSVECSVLFSDLCGFTSLTEQRLPQEIIGLLNEYFTVMSEIVLRHGGTLDKFIGDAIMAVFGAPCALEDAHGTAVRVAVEMHQALRRLQWKWQAAGWPAVRHRIGINTGPVVAGNIGSEQRMDYTVVGDAVNLAARLESLCAPMETTFGEQTYRKVRDCVMARALQPVQVRGKSLPVVPYQVLAVRAAGSAELWNTALPVSLHSGNAAAALAEGTVVGVDPRQVLLETAAPPHGNVRLQLPDRGGSNGAVTLEARLATQERRTDAAGNSYFFSWLDSELQDRPLVLRRIVPAPDPHPTEGSWLHA